MIIVIIDEDKDTTMGLEQSEKGRVYHGVIDPSHPLHQLAPRIQEYEPPIQLIKTTNLSIFVDKDV